MKPRIFIVDDEAPARARLTMLLSDVAEECPHAIVGEAEQAQQALAQITELQPDIVLLDVQMPGMTGIDLAAQLKQTMPDAPAIIFVTAFDEYALKAFDVHAFDYLLKPVRATRLAEAIRRVSTLHLAGRQHKQEIGNASTSMPSPRRHFSVQERGRVLLVPIGDVIYLKAEAKYITLRTREHEYLIEGSLSSLEQELASSFIRVHRNALVAKDAIAGVERAQQASDDDDAERGQDAWQVILRGIQERLPISRRQWSVVKSLVR
ncbi:LytTR family DNA-binding domain-containing protein [uncultured Oxalicibacterium sp.]|uniref:LytR/AlgR family response regulator transcription factor n=1 Tax=uncultured Oxalicibacterium sp. TaxID=1168540 RepID=UPI0025F5A21A|nr:LytTR family DNA-binding domain-containing protein [uncultured Oxalicibacterium sp.]